MRTSRNFTHSLQASLVAATFLYIGLTMIFEPLRTLAQDSETVVVDLTVASALGLSCDADSDGDVGSGEVLSIGTITYSGDTGVYANARAVKCFVTTNNTTGYTLGWRVFSGSGGLFTGHLISQFEDVIEAVSTASNTTASWSVAANDARWGGRVSSTSSGSVSGALDFGTDASSETWTKVATGSTQTIRTSSTNSQSGSGDLIRVGFRAEIGSLKSQPTGTYQATVTFTAAAQ